MNRTLFTVALLAVLLSACSPKAAPTIDPAQIQASAVAAASTMIAQTQQAMPTATPIPPTDVPSPTALALPSPTLGALPTLQPLLTPTTASTGDDCNQLMDIAAAGPKAPVLVKNDTKGPATLSMGISRKNSFGQCGYISVVVPKMNSVMISVPYARLNQNDPCYWLFAWVNDPAKQRQVSGPAFCLNNPDKWTLDINYNTIKVTPP